MKVSMVGMALTVVLGLSPGVLQAQVSVPAKEQGRMTPGTNSSSWQFSVSPYFWMAGIQGTSGQFNLPPADMKSDFGQIFNELDFAFMGIVEARRGPYSILGDLSYTKTSLKDSTPHGVLANKVGVTSEAFSGLLAGGYTVYQSARGHLDVIAGARVWNVRTTMRFQGGVLDELKRRDSATWVDVVAGLRGNYFLTDKTYLMAWGAVGAGQANLDWDMAAGVGYQVQKNLSLTAGYRMQGVDYSKDGFVFDVIQKGPILGLTYRF
ncbi:hypothetical protein ACXHWJ_09740 [Alcaligenes nematophilus]|uniref:hypothetical protein n=1 Tax=Alcaligenes nematophilus TaxID=2994643 RepID=UPI00384D8B96